jgi:Calx-beta domain.
VISISNSGPSSASNVIISNTVAGDVLIRSVAKSQGTTAVYGQTVVCNAGLISNGQNATVTITVRPHVSGFFTNMASVITDSFEQDNTNNSAQIALYADLALLHVNNTAAAEGSAGTNNTTVTAWLEGPVGQTISADYATTSGTATSGSDYLDVAGTIVFAPDVGDAIHHRADHW